MTDSIAATTSTEAPATQQDIVPATQVPPTPVEVTEASGVSQNQDPTKTFDETYVKDLRSEAAKYRTERKQLAEQVEAAQAEKNTLMQNLQKALGIVDPATEQSPEDIIAALTSERDKFAEERDTYQSRLAEFRRTEAIRAAAKTAAADADVLIDSRTFTDKVKNLDTDADDYPEQVSALVADAVNSNPRYKATPAVPTSSGSDPQKSAAPAEQPSGAAARHARRFGKK